MNIADIIMTMTLTMIMTEKQDTYMPPPLEEFEFPIAIIQTDFNRPN